MSTKQSLWLSWKPAVLSGFICFILSFVIYQKLSLYFSENVTSFDPHNVVSFYYLYGTASIISTVVWIFLSTVITFLLGMYRSFTRNTLSLSSVFFQTFIIFCITCFVAFIFFCLYLIIVGSFAKPFFF